MAGESYHSEKVSRIEAGLEVRDSTSKFCDLCQDQDKQLASNRKTISELKTRNDYLKMFD